MTSAKPLARDTKWYLAIASLGAWYGVTKAQWTSGYARTNKAASVAPGAALSSRGEIVSNEECSKS